MTDNSNTKTKSENQISRRRFLQILGASSAATVASGCADPQDQKLIPRIRPDDSSIPGVPVYYSSTCTECSAGCGIVVKTVDGRAIKVEGNKENLVNKGGLCGLGQSSLQSLYDPDRVRQPLKRELQGNGKPKYIPVSWEEAISDIAGRVTGDKKNIFLTGELSGAKLELVEEFNSKFNADHVVYDIMQPVAVAKASELVFGVSGVPTYSFEKADVILNFGADFLETWVSPCEYAKGWARGRKNKTPSKFIHVEPRLSLTGANADMWLSAKPGTEVFLVHGIINELLKQGRGSNLSSDVKEKLSTLVSGISIEEASRKTGIKTDKILSVVHQLGKAKHSLVLGGGSVSSTTKPLPLLIAINLLNLVLENVGDTIQLATVRSQTSSVKKVSEVIAQLKDGKVGVMFVYDSNPAFTLPSDFAFATSARKGAMIVSFTSHLDETAQFADYILPSNTGLESWGDVRPYAGIYSLTQPAMRPVFDTKDFGDLVLKIADTAGKKIQNGGSDNTFLNYLKESWKKVHAQSGVGGTFDEFWRKSLEKGGYFKAKEDKVKVNVSSAAFNVKTETPWYKSEGSGENALILYPYFSVKTFDGRSANRPWMQELPDPITMLVWDSWCEIHPKTAERLGVKQGDPLLVKNDFGELQIPAYVTEHVHPDIIAVPIGQGHKSYGRFAQSVGGGNVIELLPKENLGDGVDSLAMVSALASVKRAPGRYNLVSVSGSDSQHDRELAQTEIIEEGTVDDHHHDHGHHDVKQMYQQREHPLYEWGMSVDLAACTGCSACVVACYAENNIPVVGKDMVSQGREMSWLRIERYYDRDESEELRVNFLPMMCQHCHNAPCEPVCPVYATYHNEEGLNVMVYNRCVGTRYCSNNCSYKVRRFNWIDFQWTEPLNWQLNPDVTKRGMGVMEKCTFCVQRIIEAKDHAKDEGRLVKDGEVQPACVQSCPTEALVFGDLNDPNSNVSKLTKSKRAYKVLDHHINTQPAVSYLKDVKYRL